MRCPLCASELAYVHGHAACVRSGCPMFGVNQAECCSGETASSGPLTVEVAGGHAPAVTPVRSAPAMVPLSLPFVSDDAMAARSAAFLEAMRARRSVRELSPEPIDLDVVRRCIEAAAQAPSGAHEQPWTFVLVRDPAVRRRIRDAAEEEERAFYGGRAGQQWLDDLGPFGTGPDKPFLETAPALVAVFAHRHGPDGDETYDVQESVGIAVGILLTALHLAGLCALTHTPSPMRFLERVLERPPHERAFLLIPIGRPAVGCRVPAIARRPLHETLVEV